MKAVILAAGQGKRLGALGAASPKGLVTVGEGPIIERSITQLVSQGIEEICVVVGFQGHKFSYLTELFPEVALVVNQQFNVRGSMHSLVLGYQWAKSDLVLLDSDIIYENRGLETLLERPTKNMVLLSGPTAAGDEVWAFGTTKRVLHLSKLSSDAGEKSIGEFVGISLLQEKYLDSMVALTRESEAESIGEYEYYMSRLCSELELSPCLVSDLAWAEIDTLPQLDRARTQVFPKLNHSV